MSSSDGSECRPAMRIWVVLTTAGLHVAVVLEIAIMSTPFASYYYAAYGPVLEFLNKSPWLFWLNELFFTHLSEPNSVLLYAIRNVGRVLAYGGLVCFAIHACYLYWVKLVKRAIATRLLYAYVRHPQYACWIAASVGLAILWPRFVNIYLSFAMTLAYYALAKHEEQSMTRQHGDAYLASVASRGMFLPKLFSRTVVPQGRHFRPAGRRFAVVMLFALL